MFSDYRDLVRSLDSKLPLANAVASQGLQAAEPWLSAHTPGSAVWEMPSHLGFWDSPSEFNKRLTAFLGQPGT